MIIIRIISEVVEIHCMSVKIIYQKMSFSRDGRTRKVRAGQYGGRALVGH
jgi:hypothetical protein